MDELEFETPWDVEGRREFLVQAALVLGALGLGTLAACKDSAGPKPDLDPGDAGNKRRPSADEDRHALKPRQREALEAATARILPTDRDPGAREAEVIEFIDRELARPEFDKLKRAMLAGVVALDNFARRNDDKRFAELEPHLQDEILHQVQQVSERGRDFVKFLVLMTLEGFLGDPKYGGNRDQLGWKFIGYGPAMGEHGEHAHGKP